MGKEQLILLLQIIETNGNIKKLLHEGISYKAIAQLTSLAIENSYLTYANGKIILTDQGREFLAIGLPNIRKKTKKEWIQPDLNSKIRQIGKNDIFLPKENDLSF